MTDAKKAFPDSAAVHPGPVETVAIPARSLLHGLYPSLDLADAYAVPVPDGAARDPELLARHLFASPPEWVLPLMAVRDAVVSIFGLKTSWRVKASPGSIGIFKLYEKGADEIVMGEDDKHLDFRVSLHFEAKDSTPGARARVVVSTVVHCHNRLGRIYLTAIGPFHRQVVKAFLRRGARRGWPTQVARALHVHSDGEA